jgi:hypothetical protein
LNIKDSNLKPGDMVKPIHPAMWFPIDYETMDVWKPKRWMVDSCDFYDEDRRPLIYVGMVPKRTSNDPFWVDRIQQGRHMVYFDGSVYFVAPGAWKHLQLVEEVGE